MLRYSMLNIDAAPSGPGIYAWYVNPSVSVVDGASGDGTEEDGGASLFLEALQRYAALYEPPPIHLRGKSPYGARWFGDLTAEYALTKLIGSVDDQADLDDGSISAHETNGAPLLQNVADSADMRKAFAAVMDEAIPSFSSPLYIGISEDIKKRLITHKRDFTRVSDYLRTRPDERNRATNIAQSFGHRAAARQVAMEDLEVRVIEMADLAGRGLCADDLRDLTSSAEWYLHRLFSPVLGRR